MKTMKFLARRVSALVLVATVGLTALVPAASLRHRPACRTCPKTNVWWTMPMS